MPKLIFMWKSMKYDRAKNEKYEKSENLSELAAIDLGNITRISKIVFFLFF